MAKSPSQPSRSEVRSAGGRGPADEAAAPKPSTAPHEPAGADAASPKPPKPVASADDPSRRGRYGSRRARPHGAPVATAAAVAAAGQPATSNELSCVRV